MKQFIVCLLLGALFGLAPPPVSAEQKQTPQQLAQEIEVLKRRISELEKQLQTVENVEKMELQAKLADANAKLLNAEFGKLERDLRDSHNEWLIKWSILVLTLLTAIGAVLWFWLKSRTNQLIADEVEKSLNGFKEGLEEVSTLKNEIGILKDQQRILEKEHVASILEDVTIYHENKHLTYPELINALREDPLLQALREDALLQVISDKIYRVKIKYYAAKILSDRKSPRLVSPLLEFLNSVVDSDSFFDSDSLFVSDAIFRLRDCADLLTPIHTPEAHQGLTEFLDRLLRENPLWRDLFLKRIVFSLAEVSLGLNKGDAVPILRRAIPHLKDSQLESGDIIKLAEYFDKFNEPAGIKEILTSHLTSGRSDVADKCLELLEKHDPEFVEKWRSQHRTDNAQSS